MIKIIIMKKILLISYYFPPIGGSGTQRTVKFVKYLNLFRWFPVVVSVREPKHYEVYDDSLLVDLNNKFYKVYRTFFSDLKCVVKTPDAKIAWLPIVVIIGLRILCKEKIKIIYSTSPPVTAHLAAFLLKSMKKVKWVADFRDPWVRNCGTRGSSLKFWLNRKLESLVIKKADKIICNTDRSTVDYISRYPDVNKNKFITITNGYDESDFNDTRILFEKKNKLVITHTGEFYENMRNPENLIKALSDLIRERKINSSDIVFNLIGSGDYVQTDMFKNAVNNYSLHKMFAIKSYMGHKECIKAQLSSDVLLLIVAKGGPMQVPAKSYEYLRTKKPILLIAEDGATKDLLGNLQFVFTADYNSVESIKKAICDIYSQFLSGTLFKLPSLDDISYYSRKRLTGELAKVLDSVY